MLAARDQENLVNTHQTTAAAKPLNQNIRALNPKTPSNFKTPFRGRNDENRPLGQKTILKDGPSKFDRNAFQTPAPLQQRAPLGLKTTNAKAQPFKTPALQQKIQPVRSIGRPSTTRRSGKSKITIAPSEPVHADVLSESEEEPDFGYAPPPIKELDDPPIETLYDTNFPQFEGKNFFRGYGEIYCRSPVDENGISIRQKKEDEELRLAQEEQMREASKPMHFPLLPTEEELDAKVHAMIAAGPKAKVGAAKVDTVRAKSAASLLSKSDRSLPAAALRTTKASEQRAKPASRPLSTTSSANRSGRPAPVSVSKNTIGFPKAKAPPSIIPKADQMRQKTTTKPVVKQSDLNPKEFVRLYGQPPEYSTMWNRLKELELIEEDLEGASDEEVEEVDELFERDLILGGEEDDEVFQL
jgi:hypothetical protein